MIRAHFQNACSIIAEQKNFFKQRRLSQKPSEPSLGFCQTAAASLCYGQALIHEEPVPRHKVRKLKNEQREAPQQAADLAAAKRGDEAAFARLLKDYGGLLAKAAHQRHLSPIAEEAEATARVSFWAALKSYDEGRGVPFPGWAKAKVYGDLRTLFKQSRRRWRREVLSMGGRDEGEGERRDRRGAPDPALFAIEEDDAFADRLRDLAPRQRALLALLYDEDLTESEAARRLNISQQAASAMKRRALQKLRQTFFPLADGEKRRKIGAVQRNRKRSGWE